mmetsp:Transcript_79776/g.179965  ORF Transcript_79776/g.179965 Transcript_79776/m.179965 type:complete len:235 (+) Transcript_79776:717-1421(+)
MTTLCTVISKAWWKQRSHAKPIIIPTIAMTPSPARWPPMLRLTLALSRNLSRKNIIMKLRMLQRRATKARTSMMSTWPVWGTQLRTDQRKEVRSAQPQRKIWACSTSSSPTHSNSLLYGRLSSMQTLSSSVASLCLVPRLRATCEAMARKAARNIQLVSCQVCTLPPSFPQWSGIWSLTMKWMICTVRKESCRAPASMSISMHVSSHNVSSTSMWLSLFVHLIRRMRKTTSMAS